MARWDDLHRAIEARDPEGVERIWLELLDTDLDAVDRFLDAVRALVRQSGGKRQGGILLWMLTESLKEGGRPRDLIAVHVELARMGPDDGTVRQGLVDASHAAWPERADIEALLEKSGVIGGPPEGLAEQAGLLECYLRLEPGAYVFHRSGWGVGRIVDYLPDRGRCVIDFRDRPGHEMDIDAAAGRLERLAEDDIRVMALADPKRLRTWATEDPLEMIRQVLMRFRGTTSLRHVKDALVPDAVPTSRWSTWWKEARKQIHLDPRFHVSSGRDPRLEFHGSAQVDFRTEVERTFTGCATVEARQAAAREFLTSAASDVEARATLGELVRAQIAMATRPATRLGWDLLVADLEGRDRDETLRGMAVETPDPEGILASIAVEETRAALARAMTVARPDGAETIHHAALDQDDPVLADAGVESFVAVDRGWLVPDLLDQIDAKPAMCPNLWAWYVRGLRRGRWEGRAYEAYPLVRRLLKVLDAVEYRVRRTGSAHDKKGVSALGDMLTSRSGQLIREAAEAASDAEVRHLLTVLEQNRGIKARQLQKVQAIILRTRPDALHAPDEEAPVDGELHVGERIAQIYMTPDGIGLLKAQRDKIVNEEMPSNAKEIARAREFGDLAENAEYHAAREKQGMLQAKADQLNGDIAHAVVLTPDIVRTDAVSVGVRVKLRDEEGHEIEYTLLGPPDADVASGVINYLTPLGQALMGHKPGDHVEVVVHDRARDLEVLAIENALTP